MTGLPGALVSALKRRAELEAPISDHIGSSRVASGDIRVVQGLSHLSAEPRLGVLLGVDGDNEFADILLVHTAPELACDGDVIVPKDAASTPYDIVVQTDLRAVVWTLQLGRSVGQLEEHTLEAVKSVVADHDAHSTAHGRQRDAAGLATGIRLAGPADPRWPFKASEGQALRDLADDCTNALLDRGLVWRLDPGLLRPDMFAEASVAHDIIGELVHWAMTRTLTISDADLTALDGNGALAVDAWVSMNDIGSDVWTSLQDVIISAATGATRAPLSGHRLVTARHLPPVDEATFEFVHVIGRRQAVRR